MQKFRFRLNNKFRRYKNIFKKISNWGSYLVFKSLSGSGSFRFHLRHSFRVTVPREMLGSFRVIFFDEIYTCNIPGSVLNTPIKTIVDIGANAGHFCLYMFSRCPGGRVYAFEPLPFNIDYLNQARAEYPQFDWVIIPKAVSDSNKGITLQTETADAYTTKAGVINQQTGAGQIEVESVRLDDFIRENQLEKIDFLKIDCEGSEYAILYNLSPEVLKNIRIIALETHKGNGASENLNSLKEFLKKNGFTNRSMDEGFTGYIWAWREDKKG